jgi:hypothetical protein
MLGKEIIQQKNKRNCQHAIEINPEINYLFWMNDSYLLVYICLVSLAEAI